MDIWRHVIHKTKIKWHVLHAASSSHATWQNLSTPYAIKQTRLNRDDLHPDISFELLIKDEEAN